MKTPISINLKDKVVVITGAGGVICGCLAKALASNGAKVALLDLNLEAAEAVANKIVAEGGVAKAYKTNVLDKENLEAVREEIEKGENKTDTAQAYIKVLERKLGQAENKLSEQKPDQNQGFGEEFSERVIKEYLKKIVQAKPTAKLFGGVALVAPPKKPQTIAEASVIAKNYIKLKGE